MADKPLYVPDLTPDDRHWRIDWFGEVAYPSRTLRYSQPSIRVAISPLLCDPADSAVLLTPTATDLSSQREVWMPVGSLPMMRIGDIWKDGQRVAMPDYCLETFKDVAINLETASFIKAGLSEDDVFLMPYAAHPWHMRQTNSYCVCVRLGNGKRLVIPCAEIIRFYFGSSSNLISRLFTGTLDTETLWRKKTFDKTKRHLHLVLAPKLSGMSAPDIGRIALNKSARHSAAGIYASCVKATSQGQPAYPYTAFPFEGTTTLLAPGIWLPFGDTPDATFVAFNLRSCSYPFPFASLSYEADDRTVRKNSSSSDQNKSSAETIRQAAVNTANNRVSMKMDQGDPSVERSRRALAFHEPARFPDLKRKRVWREKIEAETVSWVFLKRANGSLEPVSFGEAGPAIGAIRPIDMEMSHASSVKSSSCLPRFVQIAISEIEKEHGTTAKLFIPAGYTKPVFPVPMVVDEDGVINEALMFTTEAGSRRRRLACIAGITKADGKRWKVVIYEGENASEPPVIDAQADFLSALIT